MDCTNSVSQGNTVLFISKEAKLCIGAIHLITEIGGRARARRGKLVIFHFFAPSVKLGILRQ